MGMLAPLSNYWGGGGLPPPGPPLPTPKCIFFSGSLDLFCILYSPMAASIFLRTLGSYIKCLVTFSSISSQKSVSSSL